MKRAATFALVILIALLPLRLAAQALASAAPEQVGMSPQRLAKIGAVFKKEIDEGRLPGAVIAIARKGKLVYYESFGFRDKAAGVPMTKDSIFRIYSMTKPLASVAAMLLVEDGSIQLTDPISKFLPAFGKVQVSLANKNEIGNVTYDVVPAARPITVHDLLRHSAGLAYGELTTNPAVKEAYAKAGLYQAGVIEYDARDMTPAEQVERLAAIPLIHQPGTVWEYSMASDVLGRVVETVSGQRLGEFLQARLFGPLQMRDSGFYVPQNKSARLAQPLATDPATGKPNRLIDVRTRLHGPPGTGHRRRTGVGRRVHVGGIRRHLFLDRSSREARGRLDDTGARTQSPVLSARAQTTGLSSHCRLKPPARMRALAASREEC